MSGTHSDVAVPLALAAAASFAVANVVQLRAVRRQPTSQTIDPRLVLRLASDRLWLAGLGASVLGFGLQAVALSLAPVILVQPLIVAELLFALPLAAMSVGDRLGQREWSSAALVTAGLGLFLVMVHPTDARATASAQTWLILAAIVAIGTAAVLWVAAHQRGITRTSAVAAAAAIVLGMLTVLTKATSHQFAVHGFAALVTWEPWALLVTGIVGLSLAQNSFHSGPLAVSLPILDVGEPIVASVIAVITFGEKWGPISIQSSAGLLIAVAVVTLGVAVLDRSPMVQAAQAGLGPPETTCLPPPQ